jgi:hypothetical protein
LCTGVIKLPFTEGGTCPATNAEFNTATKAGARTFSGGV